MTPAKRLSRREFVYLSGLAATAVGPALCAADPPAGAPAANRNPDAVLAELLAGNGRFVRGEAAHPRRRPQDFAPLSEGQAPLAVVVGCADSRVAPELVFDQGVGDLFVVRVAGNVISGAGASVKGSIEYAVGELGVRLVVVLGHSRCGAVQAAIKHIDAKDALPGSIGDLVATIRPAVAAVAGRPGDPLDNVIRVNVARGVERLRGLGPILAERADRGELKVVGANYDLRTGRVAVLG
jgi:carbonic anhydrase